MSLKPSQGRQNQSQRRSQSRSQAESWLDLNGVDDSLDNFFRVGRVKGDGGASMLGGRGRGAASTAAATSSCIGGKKRKVSERVEGGARIEEGTGVHAHVAKKLKSARLVRVKDKDLSVNAKRASSAFDKSRGLSAASTTAKSRTESSTRCKPRQVLGDLTSALQNSPRRPSKFSVSSTCGKSVPSSPSPTRKARSKEGLTNYKGTKNKLDAEDLKSSPTDSDSESDIMSVGNDVPSCLQLQRLPAPNFGKTPFRRSLKKNNASPALPTPPASSMPLRRKLSQAQDKCGLSPEALTDIDAKKDDKGKKSDVRTPFTVTTTSTNQDYPTPTSLAIPRLRLVSWNADAKDRDQNTSHIIPAPKLNNAKDSDSRFSPLPFLPGSSSQVHNRVAHNKNKEPERLSKRESRRKATIFTEIKKKEDEPKFYEVIPPSQTQYIHYSPTKQRHAINITRDTKGIGVKPLSLTVIPSSQPPSSPPPSSQMIGASLSPRLRKIPIRKPVRKDVRDETNAAPLNFAVPTSQDDEVELRISLLSEPASRTRRTSRLFNADSNASAVLDQGPDKTRIPISERSEYIPDRSQQWDAGEVEKGEEKNDKKGTGLSQSTQDHFINAMLDDLDRLVDETAAAAAKFVSPSQVLSRTAAATNPLQSSDNDNRKRGEINGGNQGKDNMSSERGRIGNVLVMRSSVTETDGDGSQWNGYEDEDGGEDPFSLTNEAYLKHLGLRGRDRRRDREREQGPETNGLSGQTESRSQSGSNEGSPVEPLSLSGGTETQSSTTQPDTDEEDPFPTLPPASASESASALTPTSTAESRADKAAVDEHLLLLSPPKPILGQKRHDAQSEGRSCTAGARAGAGYGQVQSGQTESETETETESESETEAMMQPNIEEESLTLSFPMPELVSQDDSLDMRMLTPRAVLRAVSSSSGLNRARARARDASRFRRREECSFMDPRDGDDDDDNVAWEGSQGGGKSDREQEEEEEEEEEDESIPSAVRDFLSMFSQTQEE